MQESFDICIGYHEVSAYKVRENSIPNISTLDNAMAKNRFIISFIAVIFKHLLLFLQL